MEINGEQLEALQAMDDYLRRLIPAFKQLKKELEENEGDYSEQLLKNCIDGLNWIVGIFNRTSDIINKDKLRIDKEFINPRLKAFGSSLQANDPVMTANAIEALLIFFLEKLQRAVIEVLLEVEKRD